MNIKRYNTLVTLYLLFAVIFVTLTVFTYTYWTDGLYLLNCLDMNLLNYGGMHLHNYWKMHHPNYMEIYALH